MCLSSAWGFFCPCCAVWCRHLGMEWWHMKAYTDTPNTEGMFMGWARLGWPGG